MNTIIKQLFCIEENGVSRPSLTKIGATIQGAGTVLLGVAGSLLPAGYVRIAGILGGVGVGLIGAGKTILEIGKKNALVIGKK
jgi:hypothetical protein